MEQNSNNVVTPQVVGSKDNTVNLVIIWLFTLIGGLIFMNNEDALVRAHARKAIAWSIVLVIFSILAFFTIILGCLVPFAWIGIAIYMIMEGQKGRTPSIPLVDKIEESISGLWSGNK